MRQTNIVVHTSGAVQVIIGSDVSNIAKTEKYYNQRALARWSDVGLHEQI